MSKKLSQASNLSFWLELGVWFSSLFIIYMMFNESFKSSATYRGTVIIINPDKSNWIRTRNEVFLVADNAWNDGQTHQVQTEKI